ncbi:MAG TPA: sugar phosphate isomerase/epimerase family protein [Smithellaceae bacterium]|nr:sugar phosphate isomerase/epimerase family protein [Smithellaceae bacterium]
MQDIFNRIHAHMPYRLLPQYFPMLLEHRINPEIYFSHDVLDRLDEEQCKKDAARLADAGLNVTFHAPFVDLRPGALDERLRKASLERIRQAVDLAPLFRPLKIVCHACFDERYYVDCDDLWLSQSRKTWRDIITAAQSAQAMIVLENVYEKDPGLLVRLHHALDGEAVGLCFDTGHFNAFAGVSLEQWLSQSGRLIRHLHLHDNFGKRDEHLPIGAGTFPFVRLFEYLRDAGIRPTVTLEAHRREHLWQSAEKIRQWSLLEYLS